MYGGAPTDIHAHQAAYGIATPASASSAHNLGFASQAGPFHAHEFIPPHRLDAMNPHQAFGVSGSLAPEVLHRPTHAVASNDAATRGLRLSDVSLAQAFEQPLSNPVLKPEQQCNENLGPRSVIDALHQ